MRGAAARARRWLAELPRTVRRDLRHPVPRIRRVTRAAWGYAALVAVTWGLFGTTSERFLPMMMLAYGPRYVLLVPVAVLTVFALLVRRRALVPLALAGWIVAGPIMGARLSWASVAGSLPDAPPAGQLRILTLNAQGGDAVARRVRTVAETLRPDLLLFQECGDVLWDSLAALPDVHAARYQQLCTVTRWPIVRTDSMPRALFERIADYGAGGAGHVVRYRVETPAGPLYVGNLHLETPRKGLDAFVGSEGFIPDRLPPFGSGAAAPAAPEPEEGSGPSLSTGERIRLNSMIRMAESERAAVWLASGIGTVPLIVAGDFNQPVESTIYRRHWGRFRNAFDESGTGLGWTKREGRLLRIRIDHILTDRAGGLRPRRSVLGPDLGSDHLPILADIAWPGTR
jgi:endonuclease/exonuclease/phosphatase (EEP) superfamily protein YafD